MAEPASGTVTIITALLAAITPTGIKAWRDKGKFDQVDKRVIIIESDLKEKVDEKTCKTHHGQIVETQKELKEDFKEAMKEMKEDFKEAVKEIKRNNDKTDVKIQGISRSLANLKGKIE